MKCEKGMSFEECELAILRAAVDKADKRLGTKLIRKPEVQEIIYIVETFLRKKKRMCYGGTAINNLLPKEDQFYDKSAELPDYDFWSPEPMSDAKELADMYYKRGFFEVEAKAGAHAGTFKVFVNFMPVADISFMPPELYKTVFKHAISVAGIYYSPPNFLRMLMYLELSRPEGDVSRWEKVLKRIRLLNKNYPVTARDCDIMEIQRMFDPTGKLPEGEEKKIFYITRQTLMAQGVVFFGALANSIYLRYLKRFRHKKIPHVPDFDVIADDPERVATVLKERLADAGIKKVKSKRRPAVGEIIPSSIEVMVGKETIAFIYEPIACHSFNEVKIKGKPVKIASIDTMLSFYLAFIYANRPYYDPNRIICMSHYLFEVQERNRLSQKGVLKRFGLDCYGEELHTKEKVREKKSQRYKELKESGKQGSREWEYFFLNYSPGKDEKAPRSRKKRKTRRRRSRRGKKSRKKRKGIFANLASTIVA